jgi:hypothetical protein
MVVFRAGRRNSVSLRTDGEGLELHGPMLSEPLRLSKDDIMLTAFDPTRVRPPRWWRKRLVKIADVERGSQQGLVFGIGRKRAPLPTLNVQAFKPNVAIVLARPVAMPESRLPYRIFLGRFPYHNSSGGPLRGFAFAAADLAAARAALQPFTAVGDPEQADLEDLLGGTPQRPGLSERAKRVRSDFA